MLGISVLVRTRFMDIYHGEDLDKTCWLLKKRDIDTYSSKDRRKCLLALSLNGL